MSIPYNPRGIMTLYQITFFVNFLGLIASLWLGMYLVTRNPRSPTAWLTALTLWSLGGLFLNILLALSPPPIPAFRPSYLRFLFPFWPSGTMEESNANAWLQGWSVAPAILRLPAFMHSSHGSGLTQRSLSYWSRRWLFLHTLFLGWWVR